MNKIKDIQNIWFHNDMKEKLNELLSQGYVIGPIFPHVEGDYENTDTYPSAIMILWEEEEGILGILKPMLELRSQEDMRIMAESTDEEC